jgi:pimeloyl-ACP methyl ester carboxylesterase
MPRIRTANIDIAYETFGEPDSRPLLLIVGLATQMIGWHDGFCQKLSAAGHFVIRFDNRDVGHSSLMDHLGQPDLESVMAASQAGKTVTTAYTLSDMARDAVGLLDALSVRSAHVCGISMGGMIAQLMAIEHPERVASLISMESSTGGEGLPGPTSPAMEAMISVPPQEREAYIDYLAGVYRAFSGGSHWFDEDLARDYAGRAYDRGLCPAGFLRQMNAIIAGGNRSAALASIRSPSLIIHGSNDPLVPVEHGQATADAIPGSRLVIIEGLGHGLAYPGLWDRMVDEISAHTTRATR